MYSLSEGSLEKIMKGVEYEKPILQVLGHKRLMSNSNNADRYRVLVSDGKKINSFTMLASQLNSMITDNILSEFSIIRLTNYALSKVNTGSKHRLVMVMLGIEVLMSGSELGHQIGNPVPIEATEPESDSKPKQVVSPPKRNAPASTMQRQNQSISGDVSTTPIVALSPYQNRWVIKARVTSKSNIRTWSNSRGEGKLFSMDLLDESGEIRCTAFRDQCDKFYDMIEVGGVYYISRCTLKAANKQFNNLKNDYEMTLTADSEIVACTDAADDIPALQFDFLPIQNIESKEKNDIIDVLGIVKSAGDLQLITSRSTGRELKKRDLDLVDESNTMVCLTLWGSQAEEFDGSNNPVLAIKGARLGEFNGGKNLSTLSSTVLQVDPDIPAAHRLRGWFNSMGRNGEMKSISRSFGGGGGASGPWITFKEAKDLELGFKSGPEVFTVKATVNMIRVENALYKSCPTDACKKKLIDQANEMYRCEKCDREYPNFKYRLLASASLADWSDNQWATAFSEEAEKMLDITAQELGELQQNDNDAFLEKFGDATFKSFIFKLRSKLEVFSDESRLRTTCLAVSPVDYKVYNEHLLSKIKELAGIEKA